MGGMHGVETGLSPPGVHGAYASEHAHNLSDAARMHGYHALEGTAGACTQSGLNPDGTPCDAKPQDHLGIAPGHPGCQPGCPRVTRAAAGVLPV